MNPQKKPTNTDFTSFQSGAKRLQQAMQGIPDRVPVYAQMHEFAMHRRNIPADRFYTDANLLTQVNLDVAHEFGLDIGYVDYDVYNIEAEALGQKILFAPGQMPDVDRSHYLIQDASDLHKIKTPNFDSDGRFPMVMAIQQLYRQLTGLPPSLQFTAPFSLAANLRGIEALLIDIYTNPTFARGLFDAIVEEILAPWITYQQGHYPNATDIAGADATASLPIVNLKILQEWVVPYILKLRECCGPGVYVPNWVGDRYLKQPEKMLALKLVVSPDLLEGQDPDVEALSPSFYKDYAVAQDVGLILGVGAGFLALSTPQDVRARVKTYLEAGKPGGRFALYLCNLGASTPPENLSAAVQAVHDFGVY